MPREFGTYSPVVPLGTTGEDYMQMTDSSGDPVDLTGYDVRAQLREQVPGVDPDTGDALEDPVMELTTTGYYNQSPPWPVLEAFSIPDPTDGTILVRVDAQDTWKASPNNTRRKLVWDVRLVNRQTGYTVPVVQGKPTFLPARTV